MSYSHEDSMVLWHANTSVTVSLVDADKANEIIPYAIGLRENEKKKIVQAFDAKLYDMATEYTWKRTINKLKSAVLKFGIDFVLEMLGRPSANIDNPEDTLTETDIINLSADLGIIDRTAKLLMLQQVELINHFTDPEVDSEMPKLTALSCLSTCVQYVLGQNNETEIEFNNFRDRLFKESLADDDSLFILLDDAPYFYKRTVVRTLLNLMKNTNGGERDNVLHNFDRFIPRLWDKISGEDKWSIGNTYAETISNGDIKEASYLKNVLTKVKGFDYVPETLRSQTFIEIAQELQRAHLNFNNFYNEPSAAKKLEELGTIPSPAFGTCMTAILMCKLGNSYGISEAAQPSLDRMLSRVSDVRWKYYLDEVFLNESNVLIKLLRDRPYKKWLELISEYKLVELSLDNQNIRRLIELSVSGKRQLVEKIANEHLQ
ncbi:hypothetical protein [Paenibacillus chitinolyticus]